MSYRTSKNLKVVVLLGSWVVLGLIGFVVGAFPCWMENSIGRRWDLQNSEHRRDLHRHIYEAYPALEAVRDYIGLNKRAPSEQEFLVLSALSDAYRDSVFAGRRPWCYLSEGAESVEYKFYLKLNWDASLIFDSLINEWTYDPGDGGFIVVLNP